jgi:hypothetical protein
LCALEPASSWITTESSAQCLIFPGVWDDQAYRD